MAHRKRSLTPPKNPFVARSRSSAGAEKNRFPRVDPETVSLADHQALRKEVEDLQAMVRQLWAQGHPNAGPSTLQQSTGLEASSSQHLPVTQFNFESPSQPLLNTPSFQSGPSLNSPGFQPPPYQPSYQPPSYTSSAQVTLPTTHAQNQPPRRPRRERNFTPIATPWAVVFYRLVVSGLIKPMPARPPPKILPPTYKTDAKCTFHSGQPGHDIESCWTLRYKVQDLIDAKVIEVEEINRLVTLKINQFPNHRGVNMVLGEENSDVFPPQQLIGPPGTIVVCSQLKKAPIIAMTGQNSEGKERSWYEQNPGPECYSYNQRESHLSTSFPSSPTTDLPSIPQPFTEAGATIIQNPPPIQNTGAVPLPVIPNPSLPVIPNSSLPALPVIPNSTLPVIPNSPRGIDPIINLKIKHLEEALKAMQGPNACPSTKFSDLCFFPNQPLPPKFKIPDFTKFNGTTDPMTHIRLYAGALNGLPNPNKLMMQLFQHSLTGPAAQWFARLDLHRIQTWAELSMEFVKQYRHNAGMGIDRMHLLRMEQEPEETFRVYAMHWKNSASQVEPPLLDYEFVQLFVQTLEGVYYEKLCTSIGRSFSEVIQQGEMIEEGIEIGKIIDPRASW
ncbi:hypothetical protein Vadar_027819 [Vaccinium darrowii]|uniref:Uncharacterized protein n=1 Tax=Vaccinium darrowii TaxID=229202 RepID=A0ACB7ZFR3_9ERIC|nr:hypothetical protein Vadar_027819 [Vaccinium darrowii]